MSTRACLAGALLVVALAGAACSVAANLSANELINETYNIVHVERAASGSAAPGGSGPLHITYRKRAQVSLWWTRVPLLWPIDPLLYLVFGRTREYELDNPVAHVRELLLELPDETGSDFVLNVRAAIWFNLIAQLETNSHSRLVAIDGLARVAAALELPLFQGDFSRFGAPADPAQVLAARAAIAKARPDARASDAPPDAAALQPYVDALATLTAAPLESATERLDLLVETAQLYLAEPIAAVRAAMEAPVRAALRHAIEGMLVAIVRDRSKEDVDLRLCAMEQIRRLGGPRVVPLLLAVMACTPAEKSRGMKQFDDDELVMLRLIQYCGQLRGELAMKTVQLPGRQAFELVSPAEFLAITILNENTFYSKLRTPALVALTWSLQRPKLDPDVKWVRAWREQNR